MKKSIKYAGIAAATLLTVAPIAAPVVSQAATSTEATATEATATVNEPDQDDFTAAKSAFDGQFANIKSINLEGATNADLHLGSQNATTFDQFKNGAVSKKLVANPVAEAAYAAIEREQTSTDAARKVKDVYVTATVDGKTYDASTVTLGADQLKTAIDASDSDTTTFTVYYSYVALNGDYANDKVSFKLANPKKNELKSVNAKFTTPISVAKDSKVAATQLTDNAALSLVDQNGDSVATKAKSLSNKYFYTYAAAINNNATTSVVDQANGKDIVDGKFATAGTYYQRITFTATDNSALAKFIDAYQSNPTGYTIFVNGKQASAGYDFTLNAKTSTDPQTITFVRAINVSNDVSAWTTTKVAGVVTTKGDSDYYTLKNNDNGTIKNRALSANSGWKTNAVRTDQFGNKQYRVATGEWVDANDVTFSDGTSTDNTGALSDFTKVNGTVSLDGPASFVYRLYTKDGSEAKRALAGDSSWIVSQTAKDASGNTYYKVSTTEWVVSGTGVNFK
ncbi:hypothetical protein [Companilactobacillus hulinensis]|uniref:hypothetical protein n=1 Tax=Companilactobacillus hulinensis TaxID=2486007 RepID=UPI000F796276|nr:hypothetical protein [Companilactobacillus hulinensis]